MESLGESPQRVRGKPKVRSAEGSRRAHRMISREAAGGSAEVSLRLEGGSAETLGKVNNCFFGKSIER